MPAGAAVKTRLPQPPCRTAPTVCPATTPPTPAAYNLLKELSSSAGGYADYVGGIAGCNGKNGVVMWDKNGTPTLGAILYGNNYVGGVAGYNDEKGDDLQHLRPGPDHQRAKSWRRARLSAVWSDLNCASTLPSATVAVSRVAGQQLVGGVIRRQPAGWAASP